MCKTAQWKNLETRVHNNGTRLIIVGTRSDNTFVRVAGDVHSADCAADLIRDLEELRNPKKEDIIK